MRRLVCQASKKANSSAMDSQATNAQHPETQHPHTAETAAERAVLPALLPALAAPAGAMEFSNSCKVTFHHISMVIEWGIMKGCYVQLFSIYIKDGEILLAT